MKPVLSHRTHGALASVLLLHGAALWALQQGLLQRTLELVTPAEVLMEISLADPAPASQPVTPQKPTRVAAPAQAQMEQSKPWLQLPQQQTQPQPMQKPEPLPVAATLPSPLPVSSATPAPQSTAAAIPATASATTGATASPNPNPNPGRAPGATANPAPALQPPSSDADYLANPKPAYPAMSRRLGEQGHVVVHTLIGADGVPQKADILRSSGFERLDRAALATALKWRYVPGKRGGVAEAMWFNVPLHFVLD
jgi:protein TonB